MLMENLKNYNEEEAGRRKKDEEGYDKNSMTPNVSGIMRDAQKSMPSFNTNMPSFNMPSMPNFNF